MKKQSAINQLAGYISTYPSFSHKHPEELVDLAEHILKGIQRIGLLPPKITKRKFDFNQQEIIDIEVNEWDND